MRTVRLTALFTKPRDFLPLAGTFFRDVSLILSLISGRNEVAAKVMFLQVCVCPQGGRVSASVHVGMPCPPPPTRQTPPPRLRRTPPPGSRRSTSGRYASYWNAFLLGIFFPFCWKGPAEGEKL